MKKFLSNQKGFTGVDVAISIVLLSIFLTVISTIFINIYLSYTASQRNTVAMTYATQIAELVDKLYFQDIEEGANSKLKIGIDEIINNQSYEADYRVTEYTPEQTNLPNIVKIVDIIVTYKVGNNERSVEIQRTKVKEVLITPNKPVIQANIVPVKYVISDYISGTGYWQITSENDNTWYSYDNKVWAAAMSISNLVVEGDEEVTAANKGSLIGRKVTTEDTVYVWIPKYAYNDNTSDVIFVYSNSTNIVNNDINGNNYGNLEEKPQGYDINSVFTGNNATGFWIEKSFINGEIDLTNDADETVAAKILKQSKYGN